MKYKTMNKIINKKFDEWVDSINDEFVRKLVKANTIITGGCVASMTLGEKINDFDVYFTDVQTTLAVACYYANEMMKNTTKEILPQVVIHATDTENSEYVIPDLESKYGWQPVISGEESCNDVIKYNSLTQSNDNITHKVATYVPDIDHDVKYRVRCFIRSSGTAGDSSTQYDPETDNEPIDSTETQIAPTLDEQATNKQEMYKPVYVTSNAITLSDKIQIIIRFYGDPAVIHANYDFIHVTNYWTSKDRKIVDNVYAHRSINGKELVYTGSRYPLASILRMKKFIARGWTCNAGQVLKMVFQINELNLNDPSTLEEQLTGVDVAYFHSLIETIKKKMTEDDNFDMKGYIFDVISQIFDDESTGSK